MAFNVGVLATSPRQDLAYPLDDYTTSLDSAWSTRLLLTSYAGSPLIRVKRSSDSAELDIGEIGGVLDTATMSSFVGAGNGEIVSYYDQSGGGHTATGTGAFTITSGTLNTLDGVPSANCPTSYAYSSGTMTGTTATVITTLEVVNTTSGVVGATAAGSTNYHGAWDGAGSSTFSGTITASTNRVDGAVVTNARNSLLYQLADASKPAGHSVFSSSRVGPTGMPRSPFGYGFGFDLRANVVDVVVYTSSALANIADIETSLDAIWS
jgi:hypothetical protein